MQVIHADSIEASDSDDDTAGENEKPKKSVSVSSRRRSSGGGVSYLLVFEILEQIVSLLLAILIMT